jgi:hypothetical protein
MKARIVVSTSLVLAFATMVMAAEDSIIGTWKVNLDKSAKLNAEIISTLPAQYKTLPKEEIEEYKSIENRQIELTGMPIGDNSSSKNVYRFPEQGGAVTYVQGRAPKAGVLEMEIRIAPGEWVMTQLQDGKQTYERHKVISKDGREMKQTVTVTGQFLPFSFVLVYDRQ